MAIVRAAKPIPSLPPRLRSRRLLLRSLTVRDAARLLATVEANRAYLDRWLPWVEGTRRVSDSVSFIRRTQAQRGRHAEYAYGIFCGSELIGVISLFAVSHEHRHGGEVGFWLSRSATGQGFMTEAVATLIRAAYGSLGLDRIEIRCEPDNLRSQAVARRLGFTHDGTLRRLVRRKGRARDHEVWSLLRAEVRLRRWRSYWDGRS